jgi:hypothetical protein
VHLCVRWHASRTPDVASPPLREETHEARIDTGVCDKLAAATTDFATKAGPCFTTVPTLGFTADVCRSSISKCSAADQQYITAYTDCINALPTCSPASASTWTTSFQDCDSALGPLQSGNGC